MSPVHRGTNRYTARKYVATTNAPMMRISVTARAQQPNGMVAAQVYTFPGDSIGHFYWTSTKTTSATVDDSRRHPYVCRVFHLSPLLLWRTRNLRAPLCYAAYSSGFEVWALLGLSRTADRPGVNS